MIRQKGMVLLSAVMFIVLLNLLILSELQMVLVTYKSFNQLMQKHEFFFQFEALAKRLALNKNLAIIADCTIEEQDPNKVALLLKNKQGCVLHHNEDAFYYLIETLGVFPCLQTRADKLSHSTEHFRINVMAHGKYFAFLQIRMAKLAKLEVCENPSQIHLGVLSWRYLS